MLTDDYSVQRVAVLVEQLVFHRYRKLGWSVDTRIAAVLWDIEWRTPYTVEYVTLSEERVAETYESLIERFKLPEGAVRWALYPHLLVQHVTSDQHFAFLHANPELAAVGTYIEDLDVFDPSELGI